MWCVIKKRLDRCVERITYLLLTSIDTYIISLLLLRIALLIYDLELLFNLFLSLKNFDFFFLSLA